jgi:UbiD family decarboxylase
MHADIPAFLDALRREDELVEIDAEVDPHLEIAEVHRRVIAAGGPALLFRRPKGSKIPVVTNLFGTKKRVDLCFGPRPRAFVERAVRMMHELVPPTLGKLWNNRDFLMDATRIGTRGARHPRVTEVVQRGGGLDALPMLTSWPEDGGAFVTLPLVYTEHPDTKLHNLGMYRIQRHSDNTTGMHWQIGKGGGFHHAVAIERNEDLPVTIFVGGPPALILSAIAPLPENVPELLLASLLLGSRLPMGENPVGPHRLVADAELALVGRVKPRELAPEGPFGDHYGFYSLKHDYPMFHLDALCHRKDAVWPATVVGKPRQEDLFIGDYLQELLSPLFPVVMPSVKDLWSYGETGYHALAGARVVQRYRREAMQAALRILGEGQLSLTKFLWVVDSPVDLRDARATLEHLLARFRPETDLYVLANLSQDTLDYTGPEVNLGSKAIMLGVDEPWRGLPRAIPALPAGVKRAAVFCAGCLVVDGPSFAEDPQFAAKIAGAFPEWPMVVLCDDAPKNAASPVRFLWSTFMRFEPAADLHATATRVHRNHLVREGTIVFDSRHKPTYPGELFADDATRKLVDRRWSEYFPGGKVLMGDSDAAHLDRV